MSASENTGNFRVLETPDEVIAELSACYQRALDNLQAAVQAYLETGRKPSAEERVQFCYPELRIYCPNIASESTSIRAYGKFQAAGHYSTTLTNPEAFGAYLRDQLQALSEDYELTMQVGLSTEEIPYPYALPPGKDLSAASVSADLVQVFASTDLASTNDAIANSDDVPTDPRPLALFDAPRTDYSLRRLIHYTGSDWTYIQPWILLTNYHRYVDQFIQMGLEKLYSGSSWVKMVLPGNVVISADDPREQAQESIKQVVWHRFQMPAYHLIDRENNGVTLVNIGVGPSNAKNITDHLAVLRPHCWLMIGHCGGLRQTQKIGDYVLAHAYLRQDGILDRILPPQVPIPALAEVQQALHQATVNITGIHDDTLKSLLRTGTVLTYDDRNWELRWVQERALINLARAVAVDMESGTIAAQGYRLRVPYGTLLCVSDKPLHGEIKLPGSANTFYERAVSQHLEIGFMALAYLRDKVETLHSRKLRSFDEPPFR